MSDLIPKWSKQEEEKITELMRTELLNDEKKTGKFPDRPEAIRMMQRLKHAKKWRPTNV